MTEEKERREAVHMDKHKSEMSGAAMGGAAMGGAEMGGAEMSGAEMSGAEMSGAEMSGAEMSGGRDLGERALRIATKFAIYRAQYQNRIAHLVLDERGDVPGWVLVVLMTTGLVTGIWTVAAPRIESLLRGSLDAMNNVH